MHFQLPTFKQSFKRTFKLSGIRMLVFTSFFMNFVLSREIIEIYDKNIASQMARSEYLQGVNDQINELKNRLKSDAVAIQKVVTDIFAIKKAIAEAKETETTTEEEKTGEKTTEGESEKKPEVPVETEEEKKLKEKYQEFKKAVIQLTSNLDFSEKFNKDLVEFFKNKFSENLNEEEKKALNDSHEYRDIIQFIEKYAAKIWKLKDPNLNEQFYYDYPVLKILLNIKFPEDNFNEVIEKNLDLIANQYKKGASKEAEIDVYNANILTNLENLEAELESFVQKSFIEDQNVFELISFDTFYENVQNNENKENLELNKSKIKESQAKLDKLNKEIEELKAKKGKDDDKKKKEGFFSVRMILTIVLTIAVTICCYIGGFLIGKRNGL